jgi:3-deoxy-7-phosphoheptulonate synthase
VALQQCLHFLEGLVGTRQESYFDTAGSAESVAREQDPTLGAIASEEAGRLWGLSVLRRRVADQDVNLTRFLLIGREPEPVDPRRPAKTSLVMVVRHQPGALLECLRIFDDFGINLSKLESRPVPERPWAYRFYVDFEGHAELEPAASALKALKRSTSRLKVLGTYARRTDPEAAVPTAEAALSENGEVPLAAAASRPAVPSAPSEQVAAAECLPVRAGNVELGGELFVVIADLAVKESQRQLLEGATLAKELGVRMLAVRAPAQRSGGEGSYSAQLLDRLAELGRAFELPLIVEVLQPEDVQRLARGVAMFQVGSRNMQNEALLQELGRAALPVLLHRGLSSTVEDLLRAAESVEAGGNHQVVLCERGIRTFETATAATLDLAAVPWLKERSHLPVVVDPGRATGSPALLAPLARAAAAVGADGLILPVEGAATDLAASPPTLSGGQLQALVASLVPILRALGRRF